MEFHYVVVYDSDTKSWNVIDETPYLPDGNVYDEDADWYGWFFPDEVEQPQEALIEANARNMLNVLASIWPEVDHGES